MPAHLLTPAEQRHADQVFALDYFDADAADQRLGDTQPPGPWDDTAADQAAASAHLHRLTRGAPGR